MSTTLPPGQRENPTFPRFGLWPFADRFPNETTRVELKVWGDVKEELLVDPREGLPRVETVSDFHCVTTWTRRGLRWGGVRFVDFFEQVLAPRAEPDPRADILVLRGQDGARTGMRIEDLLSPDVILADTLDGEPLTLAHGAPLRLVAPSHYGYKSIKYLNRIEFRRDDRFRPSAFRFMDHPRARVAHEERGRWIPGPILRRLYRPLIPTTVKRFAAALEAHEQKDPS